MNNPTRVISGSIALAGFVVAIVAGLSVDNPPGVILTEALVAMVACNILGSVLGMIAQRVATQHVEHYKGATPIRSMNSSADTASGPSGPVAVLGKSQEKMLAA